MSHTRPNPISPNITRPNADEYHEYYGLYVDQAPDGDIFEALASGLEETRTLLGDLTPAQETFRYAPGKWSPRDIVGHLIDTEWTFAYRGLCFARADPAALPGFDQELWGRTSNAGEQPLSRLLDTFACARQSTLAIYASLDDTAWMRRGIASECEFTVRAMPFILAGHEVHHRKVLEARYLSPGSSS
ncbi:MAG: DinB family protein [Acidobacteriota bacterium]